MYIFLLADGDKSADLEKDLKAIDQRITDLGFGKHGTRRCWEDGLHHVQFVLGQSL